MNSEWYYRGFLKSTLKNVQGDGKTFDDKMHTFRETELESIFISLEMAINKFFPKVIVGGYIDSTQVNETEINETEMDEEADAELEEDVEEFFLQSHRAMNTNINMCKNNVLRHYR